MPKQLANLERTIGFCPTCGREIKIDWTVKPDQNNSQCAGDFWIVTQKCQHITVDGGTDDGLDCLIAELIQGDKTK